jgi:hypothetical protein
LIEIDLKVFADSLDKTFKNLEKLQNKIEKNLIRLTYNAANIIANEAKRNHAFKSRTGSLVRSIHCAFEGADHSNDSDFASESEGDLTGSKGKALTIVNNEISVDIGSWLDYAYPTETGKHHEGGTPFPYILPAFENKFEEANNYIINGLNKILEG